MSDLFDDDGMYLYILYRCIVIDRCNEGNIEEKKHTHKYRYKVIGAIGTGTGTYKHIHNTHTTQHTIVRKFTTHETSKC